MEFALKLHSNQPRVLRGSSASAGAPYGLRGHNSPTFTCWHTTVEYFNGHYDLMRAPAGPLWLPMPPVAQGKIQCHPWSRRHIAIYDCSQQSHAALGTPRDQLNTPILTTDTIKAQWGGRRAHFRLGWQPLRSNQPRVLRGSSASAGAPCGLRRHKLPTFTCWHTTVEYFNGHYASATCARAGGQASPLFVASCGGCHNASMATVRAIAVHNN